MKSSKRGFKLYWHQYLETLVGVVLDMKAYPLELFVMIGGVARYLLHVQQGWKIYGDNRILINIQALLAEIKRLDLKVTNQACWPLHKLGEKLEQYPPDGTISAEDRSQLNNTMKMLESTLRAETATLNAYVLTEQRLDGRRLIDRPESFLGNKTFNKLPFVAQYDIKEAGKCIAFEVPTAGAFHLLRATEDTLRAYYTHFVKRGRKPNPMWNDMVNALKAKPRKPKPNTALLDHLDNIRTNFRNPTDHPEMIYGIDEVQNLFALVVDVLDRMAKELP